MANFLMVLGDGSRDFFVRLHMIHMLYQDFCTCDWNWMHWLLCWNFIGCTIEPICNWPVDMFRPGLLSITWSFRQIWPCTLKLMQVPVFWQNIVASQSSQYGITKILRLFLPDLTWIWSICFWRLMSKFKTCYFLLPAGGAMTISEYCHVYVFRLRLLHVKFTCLHTS